MTISEIERHSSKIESMLRELKSFPTSRTNESIDEEIEWISSLSMHVKCKGQTFNFKEGDKIVSKHLPDIKYIVRGMSENELNEMDYICEYIGEKNDCCVKGLIREMTACVVDINFEKFW